MSAGLVAEQLHYTWAEVGLQGLGRFQATAASPGLRDLESSMGRLVLRLCRYDGPSDCPNQAPRSFGWVDARGHRFLFDRRATGRDQLGRPGNFSAHVLVAPSGLLSTRDCLALADGWSWWDASAEPGQALPAVPIDQLVASTSVRRQRSADPDAVAGLVNMGVHGHVPFEWRVLLDATAAIYDALPSGVGELPSFSTYERGESADWFRLAGGASGTLPVPSYPDRCASALLTGTKQVTAARRIAVMRTCVIDDDVQWADVARQAAAIAELENQEPRVANLLPALESPGPATLVLEDARGCTAVAQAIAAGNAALRRALTSSLDAVPASALILLGTRVAALSIPESTVALGRALSGLNNELFAAFAGALRPADEASVAAWPEDLIYTAVRNGWSGRLRTEGLRSLSARPERFLSDPHLSLGDRVEIAVEATAAGRVLPLVLDHAFRDPSFARLLLSRLQEPALAALLASGPPKQAASIYRTCSELLPERLLVSMYAEASAGLDLTGACALFRQVLPRASTRSLDTAWEAVAHALIVEGLELSFTTDPRSQQLRQIITVAGRLPGLAAWSDVLTHLESVRSRFVSPAGATQRLLQALPPRDQPLAARLALRQHLLGVQDSQALDEVVSELLGWLRLDEVEAELATCARQLRAAHPPRKVMPRLLVEFLLTREALPDAVRAQIAAVVELMDDDEWRAISAKLNAWGGVVAERVQFMDRLRAPRIWPAIPWFRAR